MADIKYEIKETYGELSGNAKGWTKELNLCIFRLSSANFGLKSAFCNRPFSYYLLSLL